MGWFVEKLLDTLMTCGYVVVAFFDTQANWEIHARLVWQVWREDKW